MVKRLQYNWRQVGSVQDRDGCGEDYDFAEVGRNSVILIEEKQAGLSLTYLIHYENGKTQRVFNPNLVEYATPE